MILYFEWIKFSYEISNILTFKFPIKSFHIKYNLWNDISNTSNFKSKIFWALQIDCFSKHTVHFLRNDSSRWQHLCWCGILRWDFSSCCCSFLRWLTSCIIGIFYEHYLRKKYCIKNILCAFERFESLQQVCSVNFSGQKSQMNRPKNTPPWRPRFWSCSRSTVAFKLLLCIEWLFFSLCQWPCLWWLGLTW